MAQTGRLEGRSAPAKFERRKEAIVRAAVEVLNRKGVRGMTLAEVAAKLDLVPTAVSYYFRRKEDLAAACFLQGVARYDALIDTAAEEPTPQAALIRFNQVFADFVGAVEVGRVEPIAAFNDVRTIHDPVVDAAYTDMFRRIRRAFSERATGPLERRERNARTHLLLSQSFWAMLWLKRYEPADYPRMVARITDILLHGLIAPGCSWSPVALASPEGPVEPGEAPRAAFLRAATELINEEGYLGASVAKISAKLNVTKGSFYHHIQAKDDLVGECFERTLTVMRRTQETADACTSTGLDNVASMASALVRWEVSGEVPLLRTSALTAVPEEMRIELIARFDRVSARFSSVISDGIADGSIRPVDAQVAAHMVTAAINAGAELHHWAPGMTAEEAVAGYLRPLFVGMFASSAG